MLRTPAKESAAKAMQAAIDGGFNIVEFTLTTPGCLDLVADFRKKYLEASNKLGSIMTAETSSMMNTCASKHKDLSA